MVEIQALHNVKNPAKLAPLGHMDWIGLEIILFRILQRDRGFDTTFILYYIK